MSDNICFDFLRKQKAQKLKSSMASIEFRDEVCAEEYRNAIILPIRKDKQNNVNYGGVVDSNGEYLVSSVIPGWVSGWYDEYECESVNKKTAVYCGRMIGHWGHFLLETITRLWFFIEHDDPSYVYVLIVEDGTNPPIEDNFRSFFELLGIMDRLVFLNKPTKYEKVIIPNRSFQYNRFFTTQYSRIFERVSDAAHKTNGYNNLSSKIYLSRSRFKRAQDCEIGLQMLDNFFQKNNYQIIHPENMPLAELIVRINTADICASESGTAAHNFLFCHPEQNVVVMERYSKINYAQISIDILKKLNTTYVDSHLLINPVYQGAGPFFLHYTTYMKKYADKFNYLPPDEEYLTEQYLKNGLYFFSQVYTQIYQNEAVSYTDDEDIINEAAKETTEFLNNLRMKIQF